MKIIEDYALADDIITAEVTFRFWTKDNGKDLTIVDMNMANYVALMWSDPGANAIRHTPIMRPRVAGMVFAATNTHAELISPGLRAAELYARLEEVFPTLEYRPCFNEKLELTVDPLTREYAEKVFPELPWVFRKGVGYLSLYGFTPYCEGAFFWKIMKN
jgi:hypothetical protein